MELTLQIWKEGKFVLVSSKTYNVTTQGATIKEALDNFQDAFFLCLHDKDWREIHGVSEQAYKTMITSELSLPSTSLNFTIQLPDFIKKMIPDVKQTPHGVG